MCDGKIMCLFAMAVIVDAGVVVNDAVGAVYV